MGSFRTSARAVELLGKKQIRDSITALAELMKNAYDADAEFLQVDFNTRENVSITLCDNGVGMDRFDIENKWLVLGTKSKKEKGKKFTKKNRRVMGEKGIGRLAVARLGEQMWLISKKKDTGWNILALNWNLFENPDLLIDEVDIPSEYDVSFTTFSSCFERLKETQLKNLNLPIWKQEKHSTMKKIITSQINNNLPDMNTINRLCERIEYEGNQGTIIYCNYLNDDWNRYLNPEINTSEDLVASKNRSRMHAYLADLNKADDNFQVEVFLDGKILELNSELDDSHFDIYDLKIEGTISAGIFTGYIDARNADPILLQEANAILNNGFEVTSGINDWEKYDCGPFSIKICHTEDERKGLTSLNKEELNILESRRAISQGLVVYRDNVRILPYGEHENDFLGIEQRRSTHAGSHVFSHRNTFGRIDITSDDNPMLEDKSSREGLIENEEYYYFVRTIENLLVRVAFEILTDRRSNSIVLRDSYIKKNKKNSDDRKKLSELEKEQRKLVDREAREAKKLLEGGAKRVEGFIRAQTRLLERCVDEPIDLNKSNYHHLISKYSEISDFRRELEYKISLLEKEVLISISDSLEHRHPVEFLDKVDNYNSLIKEKISVFKKEKIEKLKEMLEEISRNIDHMKERFKDQENLILELTKKIKSISQKMERDILNYSNLLKTYEIENTNEVEVLSKIIISKVEFDDQQKDNLEALKREVKTNVNNIQEELKSLDVFTEDINVQRLTNITQELLEIESIWKDNFLKTIKSMDQQREISKSQLEAIKEKVSSNEESVINELSKENYLLSNELEIYSDLASLGLNAEMVDHEMNQLFINVFDAINQAKAGIDDEYANYYLEQIDAGFRAIASRQSQLSPGLRTRNTNRKNINIRKLLDDISFFFAKRLEHGNIDFVNKVSENTQLKLSMSKIYPVLSNIIYNSIYWVTDRKEKKILVWYDEEKNALYIEDTGPGISPRIKEKIFEPFFSTSSKGRGLGLTISRRVLEDQGYSLDAILDKNVKVLDGACFEIKFNEESIV